LEGDAFDVLDGAQKLVEGDVALLLAGNLNDERLSLTQIADLMNFTSLSYFSRYCMKHLGQSPSNYRLSLQPK